MCGFFYFTPLKPIFYIGLQFSPSKITQQVTRQLFHQIASLDKFNTQAMVSVGKIYKSWSGVALETNTYSTDGKSRFGLMGGTFENKDLVLNSKKKYDHVQI